MKHIKLIFSALFLLFGAAAAMAASGKAGDKVSWQLDKDGTLTFTGTGKMKDFGTLPYRPDFVKSVVVEEGVTSVGANAFRGCKELTSVTLPFSCKEIGEHAFMGCKSLPTINIPYGLTTIGKEAFVGCVLLTKMDLPGSVQSIGEKAFMNCRNLTHIRLPASLVSIGKNAFANCIYIEKINELPDFLTASNASLYGLKSNLVRDYWAGMQFASATPATVVDNDDSKKSTKTIPNTPAKSDVDVSIPMTRNNNDKTFVVIVSNENYTRMPEVPYAINDGLTFKSYCVNTLGVPEKNVSHYVNATSGTMREVIDELRAARRFIGDDMKVIFYYAGHGAPDNSTLEGYLMPVDASRVNPEVCISLSKLYNSLGSINAEITAVFLDACFSGGERNGGILLADNGQRVVKIKPEAVAPTGKMVVFSATDKDQTALPYNEKGHGIFTYFLLKKLKDSSGSVSLAELADYLERNVSKTAFDNGRKEQTPTVTVSPDLSNTWRQMRLN